jgi:primosomal protein N' (replication factor Y)
MMSQKTSPIIVQVALPVVLMRNFDYLLPESMSKPPIGARVKVPFGPRKLVGIVCAYPDKTAIATHKLKSIIAVLDQESLFSPHYWQWLTWASDYYHYPLGEVLMTTLPTDLRSGESLENLKEQSHVFMMTKAGEDQLSNQSWVNRAKSLAPLLKWIHQNPACSGPSIELSGFQKNKIHDLIKKNWIEKIRLESHQEKPVWIHPSPFTLSSEQESVLSLLKQKQNFSCTVLEGVTGSGKTEIYLQLIAEYLKTEKQVLWLEPEIGLTPQMIAQVRSRFDAPIYLMHSQLSDKQRSENWFDIKNTKGACLVLGTRSAIFSPFQHLDLIIIDESHDSSYQQHSRWLYCARDMCVKLAHQLNIPILLGSATPSLSTIANIQNNRYEKLQLTQRIQAQPMPEFIWIDTKDQKLQAGLSDKAIQTIRLTLENKKQVLIFINRRGFCHMLRCHHCGFIHDCDHCSMPLVWYKKRNAMACHHCGFKTKRLDVCPDCKQSELSELGLGTEQIEDTLNELFVDYPVLRIDRDHIKTAKQFQTILNQIATHEPMILVGTQMLAKGHHFKNLSTVVIINMDSAFFSTDYTACEAMGQLLLQVAGRAGREGEQGKVLLQTEQSHHPLLRALVNDGYNAFADLLLLQRQKAHLPPYAHLAFCMIEGKDEKALMSQLNHLKQDIQSLSDSIHAPIVGPIPCLLAKKAGLFRIEIIIHTKTRSLRHQMLQKINQWELDKPSHYKKIMIRLDG